MRALAALAAAVALAGCANEPLAPVVVSDMCVALDRPALLDLCPWGVAPQIGPDGFPTCSTVTARAGERVWANVRAWDEQCLPAR